MRINIKYKSIYNQNIKIVYRFNELAAFLLKNFIPC